MEKENFIVLVGTNLLWLKVNGAWDLWESLILM